jgi:hypothetical protein
MAMAMEEEGERKEGELMMMNCVVNHGKRSQRELQGDKRSIHDQESSDECHRERYELPQYLLEVCPWRREREEGEREENKSRPTRGGRGEGRRGR